MNVYLKLSFEVIILLCTGLDSLSGDITVFHAGTSNDSSGQLVTSGGRVLAVVSVTKSLEISVSRALQAASLVSFEGAFYRTDIAATAIKSRSVMPCII